MPIFWSLFGIVHLISLLLMVVGLNRLYSYIKQYRFDESHYTLLFGFVHLRWFAWLYGLLTVTWIAISFFIFTI